MVKGLIISGFSGAGIVLDGGTASLIQGNQIGTDPTGTSARPNAEGIKILGSSLNTIGGTLVAAGNLISGNLGHGIEVIKAGTGATGNEILGNLIGTSADGRHPLANKGDGILISGASATLVGDSVPGAGNVLSGNLSNGIELADGATGNLILGNLIGVTANATSPLGNQGDGVRLDGATLNSVGGINSGDGNVISSNQGDGIETVHSAINGLIAGNMIGTDPTGLLMLGNRGNGVSLGSAGNTVGGLGSGAGNTIAFNGTGSVGAGVQLVGLVNHNAILSNSIHDNAGLGINLGNGPTPNHMPGTAGPNNYQNYPILSSIKTDGSTTSIAGSLFASPSATYTIQVFSSPKADPSGFGEGQKLLTSFTSSTDATGNAAFNLDLPAAPPPGSAISATATDSSGNTSEFSLGRGGSRRDRPGRLDRGDARPGRGGRPADLPGHGDQRRRRRCP